MYILVSFSQENMLTLTKPEEKPGFYRGTSAGLLWIALSKDPKDHINIRILQHMISGMPLMSDLRAKM